MADNPQREALIKALTDPDQQVRRNAVYELGELGDGQAIEPLTRSLQDPDWEVRYYAAMALNKLADAANLSAVLASGETGSPQELEIVYKSLESSGTKLGKVKVEQLKAAAVPPLIAALKDPNSTVRWWAAYALGHIHDERALPALTWAQQNDDGIAESGQTVKDAATKGINHIKQSMKGY
jgi:HEAT repeat protein